jgi:quercetin dioxygenase-like cupin family protein
MAGIGLSGAKALYYDQPITNLAQLTGSFDDLAADEPYPGVTRRSFSSEQATVTAYAFAPGARFPRHRHAQEQITLVQRGEVTFTVGDDAQTLSAGGFSVVAPDVEHGLEAGPGGAEIVAIVVPRRERLDGYTVVGDGARA